MRLSARERTGLRAMIAFARSMDRDLRRCAKSQTSKILPLPYLEQIASSLRRAGCWPACVAHRGYYLTREPSHISVTEVLSALEGQLVSLDCLASDEGGCDREHSCEARSIWLRVQACLEETLGNITLADVL